MAKEIHDHEGRLKAVSKNLTSLSPKNRSLIKDFNFHRAIKEDLSVVRRVKLVVTLYNFVVQYLKKDLDQATLNDIEVCVERIKNRKDYSEWKEGSL